MKIAILNAQAPFGYGGAEYLAESLRVKLTEHGHLTEVVRIPFKWYPSNLIPQHILACRLLTLGTDADLAIALKFPAYMVPFANKTLWLLHQFRQAYELWGTAYQDIPNTPDGLRIRRTIVQADNLYLREAKAIFTNSHIVANRLKLYNNIDANGVLYPPLLQPELFGPGDFGDYFFYPSRINTIKRQALAIEAMRYVTSSFRLVLAGKPDNDAYGGELHTMIKRWNLQDRVKLVGWISEETKAELMANAYGVLYIPYDEDSYGYVTLEAFHSHKPVITMKDSGGTDEIIEDGFNGLKIDPTPESLAEAMERLWASHKATLEMGNNANRTIQTCGITWDNVLGNLLS